MNSTGAGKKDLFLDQEEGKKRWRTFQTQIGKYHLTRNFDLGPEKHATATSNLSQWITHRTLLERTLLKDLEHLEASEGLEKWRDELIWRLYFRSYLFHHPEIWQDLRLHTPAPSTPKSSVVPFLAWVQELETTGYLHNHARMWLASIWIFQKGLNWKEGALWMYTRLLDGDIASNTLGWRWVAGLHTKGKAYHASSTNILKFTDGRFSDTTLPLRQSDCIREIPLAPESRAELHVLPNQTLNLGLLLHPLDLSAEWPTEFQSKPTVLLPLHKDRVPYQDAGSAAINLTQVSGTLFPDIPIEPDLNPSQPLADTLQTLALKWQIDAWVTPFPGVGPYLDLFLTYLKADANQGIPLYFITDPLDLFIFSLRESSYFGFRKTFHKRLRPDILSPNTKVSLTKWVPLTS
jgi:deoxyribodipyrimidine photo-lyase